VEVTTYLVGPPEAMKNKDVIAQDGTPQGKTIHAEGEPALGVNIPVDAPPDVAPVMEYLQDTAEQFCVILDNSHAGE
jgi:hypothetical protein